MNTKLILVDINTDLCEAFKKYFRKNNDVEIINGKFEDLEKFDCVVAAGNSFGLMDGGIDLAISNYFGKRLEERVQARIIADYRGEMPIGTSMVITTNDYQHPYIAYTPTMRVPSDISNTKNAYYAMWAMLIAVDDHNRSDMLGNNNIKVIACCGLGSLTGLMAPDECARQMHLAYKNFYNIPSQISWEYALRRDKEILGL